MHQDSFTDPAALKGEGERLRWTLSDIYRQESERETARMGYQDGDYVAREKT